MQLVENQKMNNKEYYNKTKGGAESHIKKTISQHLRKNITVGSWTYFEQLLVTVRLSYTNCTLLYMLQTVPLANDPSFCIRLGKNQLSQTCCAEYDT